MVDGLLISLLHEAANVVGAAQTLLRSVRVEHDAEAQQEGTARLGARLAALTGETIGEGPNADPLGRVADLCDEASDEIEKLVKAVARYHEEQGDGEPIQ